MLLIKKLIRINCMINNEKTEEILIFSVNQGSDEESLVIEKSNIMIAVIFMNWDDPREISFQDGTRRVVFTDTDMYLLNFNEPYWEYRIENLYQVRLGRPSPGITIDLDGKVTKIKLDGPTPQLKISDNQIDLGAQPGH